MLVLHLSGVIDANHVAMMPMLLMKLVYDDILYVVCTGVLDVVCAINGLMFSTLMVCTYLMLVVLMMFDNVQR